MITKLLNKKKKSKQDKLKKKAPKIEVLSETNNEEGYSNEECKIDSLFGNDSQNHGNNQNHGNKAFNKSISELEN